MEQSVNTARRKAHRRGVSVRQPEQSVDTEWHKGCRQNADVRAEEQFQNTARKRALHYSRHPRTVAELTAVFHDVVSTGSVFTCTSCDQLLYRHSAQKLSSLLSLNQCTFSSVRLNKTTSDGVLNTYVLLAVYICVKIRSRHAALQIVCISPISNSIFEH